MTRLFLEKDVPARGLNDQRVIVVGYGSQGRGQALNLRDAGVDVRVALRPGGPSWDSARQDGWQPVPVDRAADGCDIICLLIPDMVQPEVYQKYLACKLKPGATVLFAHGLNVHYRFIRFPAELNVVMVAPKGPGFLVRREYENGSGVPCLVAVHADPSGSSFDTALAYADAIGGTRAGVIRTSFAEETETDLFGEQAVLCGGVTELVVAGWETLVQAGYSREIAYFECMHELKLIVDLLYEGGLSRMHEFISDTARYGDLTRGKRIVNDETRSRMKEVLNEIRSGQFAREWRAEFESGSARYHAMLEKDCAHEIESTGREIRQHFSWLNRQAEKVNS